MSKDTNKNDDLDLNLEEVLTPIVEKAVANSMHKHRTTVLPTMVQSSI